MCVFRQHCMSCVMFMGAGQVLPLIPSPRASEYSALAARILTGVTPGTQFVGSKAFHRCDYYAHHRPTFFTTVHMYGKSTLNAGPCRAVHCWPLSASHGEKVLNDGKEGI